MVLSSFSLLLLNKRAFQKTSWLYGVAETLGLNPFVFLPSFVLKGTSDLPPFFSPFFQLNEGR